jgi:preprotein translocase subunit SecG
MLFSFFIGLLTVVLVLDCLFLLLLILIQLPKKEAGLGQAFGSGTTDALFGAGSGTALTKMTKYAAVIFFVLTFLLAILNAQQSKALRGGRLRQVVEEANKKAAATQASAPTTPASSNAPLKATTPPLVLTNIPLVEATNAPAPAVVTNKPAPAPAIIPTVPAAITNKPAAAPAAPAPTAGTNKPAAPQPK